ncbi:MAG: NTP transferase domain-containing protein [Terracoccus sp.]
MRRTRVIIQSRLNSSRLPGKAMLTIGGMPLIELVARRAARGGHEVVVATSEEQYDRRIERHLQAAGIAVVRGSLDDVLDRFVQATADLDDSDRVVRLTGDNPLADSDLVDELVAALDASDQRYGRVDIEHVPEGLGAEAFTAGDLRRAAASTTDPYDREHVTPWLRRELGELLFVPADCPADIHAYRATVDTLGDYDRVCALFDDETDPVGRPWLELMRRLAARVDSEGGRIRATSTPIGRLSRVVVSAREFDDGIEAGPAQRAERLRSLLAAAVSRGVTHVDVGGADGRGAELLRASAEPALVRRFGVICRVPVPDSAAAADDAEVAALAVESGVERTFAVLGRRGVEVLVFPDVPSAARGWERALRYRRDGLTAALGAVVHDETNLSWALDHPDVAYLEVRCETSPEGEDMLTRLAARGCVITVASGPERPAAWVTATIVSHVDPAALQVAAERWEA